MYLFDIPAHPPTCKITDCDRAVWVKKAGLCGRHYQRQRAHGDPLWGDDRPTVCTVHGCGDPAKIRGWCNRHYRKWQNHGDPLGGVVNIRDRDELGRKRCYACKEWLNEEYFQTNSSSAERLRGRCSRCEADARHHLSLSRRNEMLAIQCQRCICDREFTIYGGRRETYHIDHDHACCAGTRSCGACIRRLLCFGCNVARGLLRDDPNIFAIHLADLTMTDILRPMLLGVS